MAEKLRDPLTDLVETPLRDPISDMEEQMSGKAVEQRSVYLDDVDLTVTHPADMTNDQVNDAIQTGVYQRPRFNFYRDVVEPAAAAGIPGVAANAAAQAAQENGLKAVTEPGKGVVRGSEQAIASLGSLSRWFGENLKRQATLTEAPDSLGGKVADSMVSWGQKHYEYWQEQQATGFEAPDPELFRGSFLSNPSWTRALTLVAEAVPSLATAATLTFATGSPLAGAAALGLTQGSEEAVAALEATGSLDTANTVGLTNTVMLTFLERFSLSRFLKGGAGKPVAHVVKGMVEEGVPEALQQAATNIIARVGYDKTRQWFDGVVESLIAGAGSGGILGGLTSGRGKQIDDLTRELHLAGVDQADIELVRNGTTDIILANAEEVDTILQKEAKVQAEKIELTPKEELQDAARVQELDTISTMLEEEKANPEGVDEEAVAVLEEMKRQREMAAPESPMLTKLKAIQEKINTFNAEGKPVPAALQTSYDTILKEMEGGNEGAPVSKSTIRVKTGMEDTSRKRLVSEMQSLKQDLRAQARGAKAGFRAGLAEGKTKIIQALQIGEMKRDAIVDYINKVLPKTERGRFITMVRDAKDSTDLAKAFMRVDKAETDFTRKTLIGDIKKQLAKAARSKNISVDVKKAIESLGSLFDTAVPRGETLKRLKATEDFIKAEIAKGNDVEMPQYILDELQRLRKMPLVDMQTDGLFYLAENIRDAIDLGKTKLKSRQAIIELQKENRLTEIEKGTDHKAEYTKLADGGITGVKTLSDKFLNVFRSIRNYQINAGNAMLPMKHFFQAMGAAYDKHIMVPMQLKYRTYRGEYSKVSTEVAELNERLNLKEENFSRIAVHLINGQETGYEKLLNTFSKKEVDAILAEPLTKDEQEMTKLWRERLDAVRPALAEFMKNVHNKDLKEVAGYFPFKTDYELTQNMDVADRLIENFGLKKNVELGFAEERQGAGNQKVRIDGLNVFLEHMDDALYAIHLGEHIKVTQEMVRTDRFKNAAGDAGQYLTAEWLDLMARKGGVQGNSARGLIDFLNRIRKNTGRASLALNPSSVLVQGVALLDGAGLIGNWAYQGAMDIWSKDWRDFAKKNSVLLANRIGDDPAFEEFNEGVLDKAFVPTKWTDGKTAMAVFIGAYQKYLSDHKMSVDFTKPNIDAILYAENIVTATQGGGQFMELPLMITKGIGLGDLPAWSKTVTQFQSPVFFKWANLTSTGARAVREGNYKLAAQIALYNLAGTAAELMVRNATKALLLAGVGAVLSVNFKEEEEKELWLEFFETMIGNIPMVGNATSLFAYEKLPAPSLQAVMGFIQSGHNAFASEDEDKKAKWATVAAIQLAGIGFGVPLTFKAASIAKQIDDEF